jgi:hypothetical protein
MRLAATSVLGAGVVGVVAVLVAAGVAAADPRRCRHAVKPSRRAVGGICI